MFLATPQGIHPIARTGDRYTAFARPTITTWLSGSERRYLVAFEARLTDGRKTVIMHPSHAPALECLTTGTRLGAGLVEDFVISRLGLALCCVATLRGEAGRYRTALIVDAGCVISGGRVAEGGQLPEHGRIQRLLRPSAVNLQLGFVTVGLDDGRLALCSRPSMTEPEVLVSTGDPLPGEPAVIQRIAPPVASAGVPNTGRFGVAAAVRTTDGRGALWVGTFGAQHPLHGSAFVPLLDEEETEDDHPLAVRDFAPVKLTNSGAALLRATTGTRQRALLLLDELWCDE